MQSAGAAGSSFLGFAKPVSVTAFCCAVAGLQGRTAILTMHSTEFGRCGNNNYGGVSKRIRDIEG